MTSQPDFSPSCPAGGSWYACGNGTQFAGCCGTYPCTSTGCPAGLLYAASFDSSDYGTFADQNCNAGKFYTCTNTDPPFLGCCQIDACSDGCSSSNLAGMYLSQNPADAQQFDPQPPLASTTTTSSASSTTASTSSGTSSTSDTATAVRQTFDKGEVPKGAIIGGVVGGLLLLCGLAFIIWRVKYHTKRSSRQHGYGRDDTHGTNNIHSVDNPDHDARASPAQMREKTSHQEAQKFSYQDQSPQLYTTTSSPWTMPRYSGHVSPAPGYTSPLMDGQVVEADSRTAYKPYSPTRQSQCQKHATEPGQLYHEQRQSLSTSPLAHSRGPSWIADPYSDNPQPETISDARGMFVRVRQGPPLELGQDNSRSIGLGLDYEANDFVSKAGTSNEDKNRTR